MVTQIVKVSCPEQVVLKSSRKRTGSVWRIADRQRRIALWTRFKWARNLWFLSNFHFARQKQAMPFVSNKETLSSTKIYTNKTQITKENDLSCWGSQNTVITDKGTNKTQKCQQILRKICWSGRKPYPKQNHIDAKDESGLQSPGKRLSRKKAHRIWAGRHIDKPALPGHFFNIVTATQSEEHT